METLTFIQGIFAMVGFLAVVGLVWKAYMVNELKKRLREVSKELETLERDLHLRIDNESREIHKQIEDVYRTTDSRFDKFENRISKKQLLNG
jgi:biopolymer transport protein ExbB/TolQ